MPPYKLIKQHERKKQKNYTHNRWIVTEDELHWHMNEPHWSEYRKKMNNSRNIYEEG
jgi:hypothetical protein